MLRLSTCTSLKPAHPQIALARQSRSQLLGEGFSPFCQTPELAPGFCKGLRLQRDVLPPTSQGHGRMASRRLMQRWRRRTWFLGFDKQQKHPQAQRTYSTRFRSVQNVRGKIMMQDYDGPGEVFVSAILNRFHIPESTHYEVLFPSRPATAAR